MIEKNFELIQFKFLLIIFFAKVDLIKYIEKLAFVHILMNYESMIWNWMCFIEKLRKNKLTVELIIAEYFWNNY